MSAGKMDVLIGVARRAQAVFARGGNRGTASRADMEQSSRARRTELTTSFWFSPLVSLYTGIILPVTRPARSSGSNTGFVSAKLRPARLTFPKKI